MLRLPTIVLVMLFAAGWRCEFTYAAQQVPRINCEFAHQRELELAPLDTGPLQLKAVYCHGIRSAGLKSAPVVSPDAQSIAYIEGDGILRVARLDSGSNWTDYQIATDAFSSFAAELVSVRGFSWASDSKSLWAAQQEKWRPSNFAKSAMRPVIVTNNEGIQLLPPLIHAAGPLDALLWADGDGLAVAQFGTRGDYYRPPHGDENPNFAIVDVRRGLLRDTLAFADIEAWKDRGDRISSTTFVRDAAAMRLQSGKVRVLLRVRQWVVWTEGQPPYEILDPYADDFGTRVVLTPDGSQVLVGRQLRTEGAFICERRPGCDRPGRPVEGVLAAMHDLATGSLLWSIRATVTADYAFPIPAISPDARFALVGLVPEGASPRIALVRLEDGSTVQTIPAPGGPYTMGFARAGLSVWTHAHGLTALYDVQPGPR
jgi:hypothetical protein